MEAGINQKWHMRKIDEKNLILPPYLSTSWKNVSSLGMEGQDLIVELAGGRKVKVPQLDKTTIEQIFCAHAKYLENDSLDGQQKPGEDLSFGFPLKIGIGGVDNLQSAMQHNPEAANMPDLPSEVLNKIISVAKVLGIDHPSNLPKPEPHCNCMHCQISRALMLASGMSDENLDEEVSDEELTFRTWDIEQKSDKLYVVINPLDKKELYNVYLGDPIGCTCGEKNCEHIKAVLNS